MNLTVTEMSRTEREFVEQTPYGPYAVKQVTIIRKQVWPADAGIYAGIYAGKAYELGTVYNNGIMIRDWSTPWKEGK
jgi:hypothetical protein